MFDPFNPEQIARLRRAIKQSEAKLDPYDSNRKLLQETLYDPVHENEEVDSEDREPVNTLDQAVTILTRAVVDQNPTLRIVRTRHPRMAGMLKAQLHHWADETNLAATLQGAYQEALLRWGIVFNGYDVAADGSRVPFAVCLDFDDYFIDMSGNDETDIDFEGHQYSVRYEELLDAEKYYPEQVAKLKNYKEGRRKAGDSPIGLYDRVELRNVYLPREGISLVLAHEHCGVQEPIRVIQQEWPNPYIRLDLGKVRGSMVPVSRLSMAYDLANFEMRTYRHVLVQADAQLEAYGYTGEMEKDADKHRTLRHGEYSKFDGGQNSVWPISKGGVNTQTLATGIHASSRLNEDLGNIRLVGGLGASTPTARQEAQLGAGVTQMITDSRQRVQRMTRKIYEAAGSVFLNDTQPKLVEWKNDRGETHTSQWSPETAATLAPGDPDMEIVPGSMVSRTGEEQLASLSQAVERIARTFALPGEQPPVFNHTVYRELEAEYGNRPELDRLFGVATNPDAVVPGVESAGQFGANQGRPPNGGAAPPNPNDRMMERMIYSGQQQQQAVPA
jgi:hypothetical protein